MFFFVFPLIWQLEASRCVQKDVRGCANIFHYRKPHSENFTFSTIFDPPLGSSGRHAIAAGGGRPVGSAGQILKIQGTLNQDRQNPYR